MATTKIPAELVAVNAIQGTLIADNAITAVHIATNAVSGTLVADNAITAVHIATNGVTPLQIQADAVTGAKIADDAIDSEHYADLSIDTAHIAAGQVTEAKLAANSVTSAKIVNGTIVAADLADDAVTIAKMASLARGSIIYGNSAGNPAALSVGSANQLLTSDGTDVTWSALNSGIDDNSNAIAMTIDSSENVGIGTTAPEYSFVVAHDSTATSHNSIFRSNDSTASQRAGGGFNHTGSSTAASRRAHIWLDADGANFAGSDYFYIVKDGNGGDTRIVQQNAANMDFQTNGTLRQRIDTNGNVQFGPHAADIQIKPHSINSGHGSVYLRGNASNERSSFILNHYGHADWHVQAGGAGNGKFSIANSDQGDDFVIDTAGKVGIGTASPGKLLDVTTSTNTDGIRINGSSANASLIINNTASNGVSWDISSTGGGHGHGDGGLHFGVGFSAPEVTFKSDGKVGIGTHSPKDLLHIQTATGDGHAFGGKSLSLTTSFQTGAQLAITLGDHQGCYVKVFVTGDWSSHSAIAFLGEYFVQNGAGGYAEPGVIIREIDNTATADSLSSQIVDSSDDTFQIQFKLNHSTGANTASGKLQYQLMGQFDTIA